MEERNIGKWRETTNCDLFGDLIHLVDFPPSYILLSFEYK